MPGTINFANFVFSNLDSGCFSISSLSLARIISVVCFCYIADHLVEFCLPSIRPNEGMASTSLDRSLFVTIQAVHLHLQTIQGFLQDLQIIRV